MGLLDCLVALGEAWLELMVNEMSVSHNSEESAGMEMHLLVEDLTRVICERKSRTLIL
jgi:hypothetical protein